MMSHLLLPRRGLWLACFALLCCQIPATPARAGEVLESQGSFTCQRRTIAVDRFEPKSPGRHPAVLILHGSQGMEPVGTLRYQTYGRLLASRGYVAHVVHYFDRTGHRSATIDEIRKNFAVWGMTVAEAVTNVTAQPNVDRDRVGLLGFSLGAYLGLSAAMYDVRVTAVVDYFGGLPEVLVKSVRRMPPTLILHGDADKVVSVEEARILERVFREKAIPFEIRIYPGQGHWFEDAADRDATERTMRFLEQHVAKTAESQVSRRDP